MTSRRELEALAASWEERGDLLLTASECAAELRRALASTSQCVTVTSGGFEEFWRIYPRRDAKIDAQKAWKQAAIGPELAGKIMAHVERRARLDPQWLKGRRFIPLPATFLRGQRWNDEWQPEQQAERPAPGGRAADRVRTERGLAAQRALDALRGAQ